MLSSSVQVNIMKSAHITKEQSPASPQNVVAQKHENFSQGIDEYPRTRERPASMSSLFGSSEKIDWEIQKFWPRDSTFNHLIAAKRRQRNILKEETNA